MQLTTSWQGISSATLINSNTIAVEGRYTSQSTTGNYTDTEFRLINYANSGDGWRTTSGTGNFTGAFTDSGSVATYPNYVTNGTVLLSISKRIYHNSDGTKSFNLGGHVDAVLGGTRYNANPPQTVVTLPKINRRSEFSLSKSTFNIGVTIKATITQYVSAYHQNLYMVISGSEVLIQNNVTGTIDIETNLLANQIYQAIPNAKYLTGTFKLYTYDSSNNLIGTVTKDYRANVVDSEPTFDIAYQDTNATTLAITSDDQEIIQNNSTLQFNFTNVASRHYSTLSSYSININGEVRTASISTSTLDVNWGVVNLSNDSNVSVSVTDSRGFTTTKTVALSILAWQLPTAQITLNRKQNYYTATDITADATYSSLDGNNTITIQYRTKKTSEANYGSYSNLTDNVTTTFNADNQYAWDVQVLLTDKLGSTTYNLTLGIGLPIFFIDRQLRSIGVNCFPVGSNTAEVNGVDITNTYSQTEIPVGTWIDGKTIYRKVIPCTTGSTGGTAFNYTATPANIDTMVNVSGILTAMSARFPINAYYNSTYYISAYYDPSGYIKGIVGSSLTSRDCVLILEYTKSS